MFCYAFDFGTDRIVHCVRLLPLVQETWVQFMVGWDHWLSCGSSRFSSCSRWLNCFSLFSRGACKLVNSFNWSRQDISLGSTVVQSNPMQIYPSCLTWVKFPLEATEFSYLFPSFFFITFPWGLGGTSCLLFHPCLQGFLVSLAWFSGKWASIFHPFKSETQDVMLTCLETTCCQCRISLYISKSVPSSSLPTRVSPSPRHCALQYNKPCLKYINLAHNSSHVHPEGENRHYWLPVPGMFSSWLITEPAFCLRFCENWA